MKKAIDIFSQQDTVRAALSLSLAGNMKFRGNAEDIEIAENQRLFLSEIGVDYGQFVYGGVAHGTAVAVIGDLSNRRLDGFDALIVNKPGIYVGITVADCFPVYFYDKKAGLSAVAHAGWRGTVKGVIIATLDQMIALGSCVSDIIIEFGPGISQANFEFHYSEMIKEFGPYSQDKYIDAGSSLDKINVDLQAILADQIVKEGVPLENVRHCQDCTFADEKFFSARRNQGESHSAMLAVIGTPR